MWRLCAGSTDLLAYHPAVADRITAFPHPLAPGILTIPSRRPIKPVYIRKLVQMIDAVRTPLGSP